LTLKLIGLILSLIFFDQVSKIIVLKSSLPIAYNTGISFGMLSSLGSGVIVLNIIIIFVLLYLLTKPRNIWFRVGIVLLLAGSVSNLIDRLARGNVIDFIKFPILNFWPFFNMADVAITLGIVLVILSEWKSQPKQE